MPNTDRLFVIWSIEHDAWWAPNRIGYTRELHEAGRYSEAEAREIVRRANVVAFHEAAIPLACVELAAIPSVLLAQIRDDASSASLCADDRARLATIERLEGPELVRMIHHYYGDLDRANRTPRAFLYLHLGMLIGAWNGPGSIH